MRLDKFLKLSRLIKRRTVAKDVSDQGRVWINGRDAKPSKDGEGRGRADDSVRPEERHRPRRASVGVDPQGRCGEDVHPAEGRNA